jgi:hypothetical protein
LGMQGLDEHTSIKRKAVFAAVIVLGFASRGILAHAEHADENLPPHQTRILRNRLPVATATWGPATIRVKSATLTPEPRFRTVDAPAASVAF